MFNRSAFNLLPFNRQERIKYGKLTLSGSGNFVGACKAIIKASLTLQGEGGSYFSPGEKTIFRGEGTAIFNADKLTTASLTLAGAGIFESAISQVISYKNMAYLGVLEPGDIITIDTDRKTVKRNGNNFLFFLSGDFFNLSPGENLLSYSDNNSSRNLSLNISIEERFI